MLYSQHVIIIS